LLTSTFMSPTRTAGHQCQLRPGENWRTTGLGVDVRGAERHHQLAHLDLHVAHPHCQMARATIVSRFRVKIGNEPVWAWRRATPPSWKALAPCSPPALPNGTRHYCQPLRWSAERLHQVGNLGAHPHCPSHHVLHPHCPHARAAFVSRFRMEIGTKTRFRVWDLGFRV
jgi:hypothetical protein